MKSKRAHRTNLEGCSLALSLQLIVVVLLSLCIGSSAQAEILYEECKFSDDTKGDMPEYVALPGVNIECYSGCSNECGRVFGLIEGGASIDGKGIGDGGSQGVKTENADKIIELNRGRIIECINTCVSGRKYTGSIRSADEYYDSKSVNVSTSWYCPNRQSGEVFFKVNSGDTVRINIVNAGVYNDVLGDNMYGDYYSEGRRSTKFYPKENTVHWQGAGVIDGKEIDNEGIIGVDGIRNNTGINLKDGDYLSIAYKGRFYGKFSYGRYQFDKDSASRYNLGVSIGSIKGKVIEGEKLAEISMFKEKTRDTDPNSPNPAVNNGSSSSASASSSYNGPYGLTVRVVPATEPTTYKEDIAAQAGSYNDQIFPHFIASGNLVLGTKVKGDLQISYTGVTGGDVYGGFNVEIDWKGGKKLPEDVIKIRMVKDANDRKIVGSGKNVKINPVGNSFHVTSIPGTYKLSIDSSSSVPFGAFGIEVVIDPPNNRGLLCSLVDQIKRDLFGSRVKGKPPSSGLTYDIYQNLQKGLSKIIYAMLLLYCCYMSFAFSVGLRSMTHKEFVGIALRMGFVMMLLSENSWDILYNYMFAIFIDGTNDLIKIFSFSTLDSSQGAQCGDSGPVMIADISTIWGDIFSDAIMAKIGALFWFGLTGAATFIILVVVMIYGAVVFSLVSLKVLMVYMISNIMIGMMLALSPMMMPLILFGYTRTIFDNWLKQVVMFTLQPVIVCVAFSIFRDTFMIVLKSLTSFTICKTCMLDLVVLPFCIFRAWVPIKQAHFADASTALAPLTFIAPFLVAQAASHFVSLSSQVLSRMISFTVMSAGGESMGQTAGGVASAASTGGSALLAVAGLRSKDISNSKKAMDKADGKKEGKKRKK